MPCGAALDAARKLTPGLAEWRIARGYAATEEGAPSRGSLGLRVVSARRMARVIFFFATLPVPWSSTTTPDETGTKGRPR